MVSPTSASRKVRPASREPSPHRYLLQPELQAAVVHHDVEELHHVRLRRRRRDPLAADPLRVHHPGRAGAQQLRL